MEFKVQTDQGLMIPEMQSRKRLSHVIAVDKTIGSTFKELGLSSSEHLELHLTPDIVLRHKGYHYRFTANFLMVGSCSVFCCLRVDT